VPHENRHGRIGLCWTCIGAYFAGFGHDVARIDKGPGKIERLNAGAMPIFEPGLAELVAANARAERLSFTTDLPNGIEGAGAIFIAVGTPSSLVKADATRQSS
jgi:UDPglucose 6-dehydrogenase